MPRGHLVLRIMLALSGAVSVTAPTAAAAQQSTTAPSPKPAEAMVDDPCPADTKGRWALSEAVLREDWPWLCRYRAENRAITTRPHVVFMGDSITEGWIAKDPDMFAHGAVDRGISGQTTPQMLVRFTPDVIALHPRVVHIMGGTNDIAGNTGPTTVDAYKDNIRAMVTLAKANGIAVVLGSILPADHFDWRKGIAPAPQIIALNAWLKGYAAANRLAFADYYHALAGPHGELPATYSGDGVHPNAAGYAVMRPIAERAIAQAERLHRRR